MAKIIWTDPALSDLEQIADYIALDNPSAAKGVVKKVFEHVQMLEKHPALGPRIPEMLPSGRFRQIIEPPCRIFYRHDRRTELVYIVGVMRSERLFRKGLLRQRSKAVKSKIVPQETEDGQ